MTAFNFKKSFVQKIESGEKTQTIRSRFNDQWQESKRHWPKVGGTLQIYFGLRTQYSKKILEHDPRCTQFSEIILKLGTDGFADIYIEGKSLKVSHWMDLANRDGFENPEKMFWFWIWHLQHLCRDHEFNGFLIGWGCRCIRRPSKKRSNLPYCINCGGIQKTKTASLSA